MIRLENDASAIESADDTHLMTHTGDTWEQVLTFCSKLVTDEQVWYPFAVATTCRSCGAVLPEGAGRCPACLAIVKRPGFFQRLFGGLKFNVSVSTSPGRVQKPLVDFQKTVRHSETFQIQDARTGETKVYHSLDEVPEEYREKLRGAMPLANVTRSQHVTITHGHVTRTQEITVIGPDGVPQTYKSMDEVPESVRELMKFTQPPPPPAE